MKTVNKSRYLVVKTIANSIWDFPEMPTEERSKIIKPGESLSGLKQQTPAEDWPLSRSRAAHRYGEKKILCFPHCYNLTAKEESC